jgi:hypothetical protein
MQQIADEPELPTLFLRTVRLLSPTLSIALADPTLFLSLSLCPAR